MTINNDEITAVENTLRAWYEAIHIHDLSAVADFLTSSFLMIEHINVLTKTELMAYLEQGVPHGSQTAELKEFKTHICGDVAWTTLYNFEVWTPHNAEAPMDFKFIETVILQKINDRWLIDRYHATNFNPSPTPPV